MQKKLSIADMEAFFFFFLRRGLPTIAHSGHNTQLG